MSHSHKSIPAILDPYLQPRRSSLVLLTSTLNATTNWLLLRFIAANLAPLTGIGNEATPKRVVLLSFLRDWEFWREGARKIGVDLNPHTRTGKFLFIDGLTELFSPSEGPSAVKAGVHVLQKPQLCQVEDAVLKLAGAANEVKTSPPMGESSSKKQSAGPEETVLLIDGIDALMAATELPAQELLETIAEWQLNTHSTVVALAADHPFLTDISSPAHTPVETNQAALLVALAHRAEWCMSARLLSTGAAKDVSGVLRVTLGGSCTEQVGGKAVKEAELLYFVAGDGTISVWERGSGMAGEV